MDFADSLKQLTRSLISMIVNERLYDSAIDVASSTSCSDVTPFSGNINAFVFTTSCANAATTDESIPPLKATTAPRALADCTLAFMKRLSSTQTRKRDLPYLCNQLGSPFVCSALHLLVDCLNLARFHAHQ